MDREPVFKHEADACLKEIKLTEAMKNRIRAACRKEDERNQLKIRNVKPVRINYKKLGTAALVVLACTGTLMAMDQTLGLGLFLGQKSMKSISDEIQSIENTDENQGVKMEIGEAVNQAYGAVMTVSFRNLEDKPWPKDIECRSLELFSEGKNIFADLSDGKLSADGKELKYCIDAKAADMLLDSADLELRAKHLVQNHSEEKTIKVPLSQCVTASIDEKRCSTKKLRQLLREKKGTSSEKIVLDEAYPSVSLEGIGIWNEQKAGGKTGLVVLLNNEEEPEQYDAMADAYFRGEITELTDIRTGKTYEASYDSSEEREVLRTFPDLKAEQIPYLVATKVEYQKQNVINEGQWKIPFKLEKNKNITKWTPNQEIQKGNKTIHIESIYLSTAGVQIKEYTTNQKTNEIIGDFGPDWLEVKVIDDKGNVIKLGNGWVILAQDQEGEKPDGTYVVSFNNIRSWSDGDWLIDAKHIKKIMIDEHVIEKEK